jgi:hypothetical protein
MAINRARGVLPPPGQQPECCSGEHGPLIMTVGDPMQSTQRVKDGRMVQVNRAMGGKRFTINVTEFEKSPDSHLVLLRVPCDLVGRG